MKRKLELLWEKFRKDSIKDKIIKIFIFSLLVCIAVFLIEFVVWAVKDNFIFALPLFHQDWKDTFMDFFNVNFFVAQGNNPYTDSTSLSSYPPLALLIAKGFALLGDYSSRLIPRIEDVGSIFSAILYFLLFWLGSGLALNRICKDMQFQKAEKTLLMVIFFFSAPALFLMERANYLMLALLFVLVFFALYGSERRILREFSYFALAAAFGVKLYPIAFGIVLFKDRRWFALIRLAFYCLIGFFLPFFSFSGGLANFPVFMRNLVTFAAFDTPYNNYALYQIWYSIRNLFGQTPVSSTAVAVGRVVSYCICLLCVLCAFICRKRWQYTLSASLFIIYVTTPCYMYVGVMLIVPILFFLAEKRKTKRDYLMAVLFIIIMQPMYLGYIVYNDYGVKYHVTLSVFLQSLAMLALVGCCLLCAILSVKAFLRAKRIKNASEEQEKTAR